TGDCLPVSLMMAFSGGRFGAGRFGLALQDHALRKNSKVVASVPAVKENRLSNHPTNVLLKVPTRCPLDVIAHQKSRTIYNSPWINKLPSLRTVIFTTDSSIPA